MVRGLAIVLSAEVQVGSKMNAYFVKVASFVDLAPVNIKTTTSQLNSPTTGFSFFCISGKGFGVHSVSPKIQKQAMRFQLRCACAATIWNSDSQLMLRIASGLNSRIKTNRFLLSMHSQQASANSSFIYDEPSILGIKAENSLNIMSTCNSVLILFG